MIFQINPTKALDIPRFEQERCEVALPRGVRVICGQLVVLADRSDPESDTIRLSVAILLSHSDDPAPDPVVNLSGGPGGVTVPYLTYTFRENYRAFLETRDFIMFDQRGVGLSEPSLDCPELTDIYYDEADVDRTREQQIERRIELLLNCQRTLLRRGNDLTLYSSAQSAADLNDLREVLGYDEWNLFGVSYGTKLALTTMRDFPEGIRSVILDSNYPLQVGLYLEIAANQQRAFDLLFETCADDPTCSTDYPNIDTTFYDLVDQYNAEPVLVSGRHTYRSFIYSTYVTGDMIADYVFGMLYRKEDLPTIPGVITDLSKGNRATLLRVAQTYYDSSLDVSEGMHYSVRCAEEVSFIDRDEALTTASNLNPALRGWFNTYVNAVFDVCAQWHTLPADPIENEPVRSDIPALVFSGQYDPITPPAWGQMIADDLENSFFYVLPNISHGAVRSDACALKLAVQFIDDPTTEPDSSCVEKIPPIVFERP